MFWRAHVFATRLIDSVVLRVHITHSAESAPMNDATLARASSYRSVASMLSEWTPRWTFEL